MLLGCFDPSAPFQLNFHFIVDWQDSVGQSTESEIAEKGGKRDEIKDASFSITINTNCILKTIFFDICNIVIVNVQNVHLGKKIRTLGRNIFVINIIYFGSRFLCHIHSLQSGAGTSDFNFDSNASPDPMSIEFVMTFNFRL